MLASFENLFGITQSETRKYRRHFYAVLAILLLLLLVNLVSTLFNPNEQSRIVISDITFPMTSVVAASVMGYAAFRSRTKARRQSIAWTLMAGAMLAMAIGDLIWGGFELGLGEVPDVSAADFFYLLYYPLLIGGMLLLPGPRYDRRERLKITLDMLIVILSASLVYWNLVVGPMLQPGENMDTLLLVTVAYPIGDLVLLWVVFGLLFHRMRGANLLPLVLIGLSAAVQALSDTLYISDALANTYLSGGWLDLGWLLSYILCGLAGLAQVNLVVAERVAGEDEQSGIRLQNWLSYLPYFWIVVAFLILILSAFQEFPMNYLSLVGSIGVVIGLALVRQVLNIQENQSLYQQVQRELEERQNALKALRESEERYRTTSQLTSDYVYSVKVVQDGSMQLDWATEAFFVLTGFTAEELRQRGGWFTLPYPEDTPITSQRRRRLAAGQTDISEYRIMTREKDIRWVRDYAKPELDARGQVVRIVGATQDITERKRSEQALRESENRLVQFMEALPTGMFVLDRNGKPFYANRAAQNMLGNRILLAFPLDQLARAYSLYRAGTDAFYPNDEFPIIRALKGEFAKATDLELRSGQQRRLLEIQANPIRNSIGEVEFMAASITDIGEQRSLEKALASQTQRFEELAALAQATAQRQPLDASLHGVLEALISLTNAERAQLFLADQAGTITYSIRTRGETMRVEQGGPGNEVMERGLAGWVYRRRIAALVADVTLDGRWVSLPDEWDITRSALLVPIEYGDESLGVLSVFHRDPGIFNLDHQRFLQALASQVAVALKEAV